MHTPNRVGFGARTNKAAIDCLGKAQPEFIGRVIEKVSGINVAESIHGAMRVIVDEAIDQRIGIDALKGVISKSPILRVIVTQTMQAAIKDHFASSKAKPESLPREVIEGAVTDLALYFVECFDSGSLYDRIGQLSDAHPGEDGIHYEALLSSELFQQHIVDTMVDFARSLIDSFFEERMKDTDVRDAYFGHFVTALFAEELTTPDRVKMDSRWIAMMIDAIEHGVAVDDIVSLIGNRRNVGSVTAETRQAIGVEGTCGEKKPADKYAILAEEASQRVTTAYKADEGIVRGGSTGDVSDQTYLDMAKAFELFDGIRTLRRYMSIEELETLMRGRFLAAALSSRSTDELNRAYYLQRTQTGRPHAAVPVAN